MSKADTYPSHFPHHSEHRYSHKQYDASVGHGEGQSQNTTAHDGVTEVKDGHPKRRVTRVLRDRETELTNSSRERMNMLMSFRTRILHILLPHISSSSWCHWWETSDSLCRPHPEVSCNRWHKHVISDTMLRHFTGSVCLLLHDKSMHKYVSICCRFPSNYVSQCSRCGHETASGLNTQQWLWPVNGGLLWIDGCEAFVHAAFIVCLHAQFLQLHTLHVYR